MATTRVEVKSAWLAKINWTQVVGMAATGIALLTGNRYEVPTDVQLAVVTVIQGGTAIVTWVLRTWFNNTVTPGAAS